MARRKRGNKDMTWVDKLPKNRNGIPIESERPPRIIYSNKLNK